MSITKYKSILNDLIDFNFIDYKNNILNELMSFNLDPTHLFIMKILYLNNIPTCLWEQFFKYLPKDNNILHFTILFNNTQIRLCYKFNIINYSSKCITCEPKKYFTCNICKHEKFYIKSCKAKKKCKVCDCCVNEHEISHDICNRCFTLDCSKKHNRCCNCFKCWNSDYTTHIYCDFCHSCYDNGYHFYCVYCKACQNNKNIFHCKNCNKCCDKNIHKNCNIKTNKYCEECNEYHNDLKICKICYSCRYKKNHKFCNDCNNCYHIDTTVHKCLKYCLHCLKLHKKNDIHYFCDYCNIFSLTPHIFDKYTNKCIEKR